MKKPVTAFAAVMLALALANPAFANGLLISGGVGYDVFDGGLALGAGAGYEIGEAEVGLIFMFSTGSQAYDDSSYKGTYSWSFLLPGLRVLWTPRGLFGSSGLFPILGSGFFYASYSYTDDYTYKANGLKYKDSASYGAGGMIADFGLGFRFSRQFDLRFEVPVLVFFSTSGKASAVAIPLLLSGVLHIPVE